MSKPPGKLVVFVTGAFLGNNCWDEWISYFESVGYKCIAPAWPFKNASPEELRNRHPDAAIASNTINTITNYFASIIQRMPEKPILIGHSVGGLVVQLLLQRGMASAGVGIHSFPTAGISRFRFSFFKEWWPAMGFFSPVTQTYMMTFRKWRNAVANDIEGEDQKQFFYKYATPESKLLVRELFGRITKIDLKKPHAPLLLLSGSQDKMIPTFLNQINYESYRDSFSIRDHKKFDSHGHLVFDSPFWKEEAEYVFNWLQQLGK